MQHNSYAFLKASTLYMDGEIYIEHIPWHTLARSWLCFLCKEMSYLFYDLEVSWKNQCAFVPALDFSWKCRAFVIGYVWFVFANRLPVQNSLPLYKDEKSNYIIPIHQKACLNKTAWKRPNVLVFLVYSCFKVLFYVLKSPLSCNLLRV